MSEKIKYLPPRGATERERDFAINRMAKMLNEGGTGFAPVITDPQDGDVVTYDDDSGAWVNKPSAGGPGGGRELLTANRDYYVNASTGSDSNDGLDSGTAFATIQKAIDTAASLDLGIYDVTINVADGTYDPIVLKRCVGAGMVSIVGNAGTPANVHLTSSAAAASIVEGTNVVTVYNLSGLKLSATGSGTTYGIRATGATVVYFNNLDFGAASVHVNANSNGYVDCDGATYRISGGGVVHIQAIEKGYVRTRGASVTLTGTPAFSNSFANSQRLGLLIGHGMSFSGSATGPRYSTTLNGVLFTNGAGANYFPGNSSGSVATGGQYV